jgi:hypothetical protein
VKWKMMNAWARIFAWSDSCDGEKKPFLAVVLYPGEDLAREAQANFGGIVLEISVAQLREQIWTYPPALNRKPGDGNPIFWTPDGRMRMFHVTNETNIYEPQAESTTHLSAKGLSPTHPWITALEEELHAEATE